MSVRCLYVIMLEMYFNAVLITALILPIIFAVVIVIGVPRGGLRGFNPPH